MTLSNRAPRDATASILAGIAPNAARLKEATNSTLGRALIVAINVHLLALGAYWAVSYATFEPPPPVQDDWRVIDIAPPTGPAPAPPIAEATPGGGTPTQAAGVGTPVPVPEA